MYLYVYGACVRETCTTLNRMMRLIILEYELCVRVGKADYGNFTKRASLTWNMFGKVAAYIRRHTSICEYHQLILKHFGTHFICYLYIILI